jgi:PhoPQ-activated pathogenicity-related protein
VAGIDQRLKVAVPVYGCGFLAEDSAWQQSGVFDNMPPEARQRWIANFDPSRYLPGVSCPILFVNGTNDFAYPLDSYRKSYELVTAPRTLSITVNMPHSHEAGWAPKEIGAFVDSVLKHDPPLATLSPLEIVAASVTTQWRSPSKLVKAELHCTAAEGSWRDRQWTSRAAHIDEQKMRIDAELPSERPLTCFITATDERGLTVSTPHVELAVR